MADITKITARSFVRNVRSFEELIETLNIGSIEDIPTREELEATITAGNHTARDIWFAKMYKNGLNLKITQAIREGKYNLSDETKNILYHMEATFPPVSKSKESIGGIVGTIKSHIKNIPDYYTRKYIDIKPELKKVSGTDSKTLNTIEQIVMDVGLPLQKEKITNIFNYIEDMDDYDNIMRKIFTGISSIPDKTLRRNILINLLGTRFDQNLDMAGSKYLARMGDPERAWYNPKTGIIIGEYVKSGKKQLPPNVPLGPFMRDMMDQQWVDVTNGGKLATDVGMWDSLPENISGGDIVNKYLFKVTTENPQGIFTNEEIELLGRVPKGFTDLRRLTLAWNARKTGNEAVADQLLGHGVDPATGKALTAPSDGVETVTAVGRGYYLPGKPTPIENLRAFNISLEQNAAKLLGHKDYHSLNGKWNVIGTDLKTGSTGRFINDVKVFKQETIIYPDSADSVIKLQELSKQDLDFAPDPEIIEAREAERLAQTTEGTVIANFNIVQKAISLSKQLKIPFEEAHQMITDRSTIKKPPIKLTGISKEVADRIDSMTTKDGKIDISRRLDNQVPATEADIKNAEQQTKANRNTRAGRNTIKNFLKGLGKYIPVVSGIVGGYAAIKTLQKPSEAFEAIPISEDSLAINPNVGKLNLQDQVLAAFGIDTGEKRQKLRAGYEAVTGLWPKMLQPPSSILIPTKEEKKAQLQHHREVQEKLAEEEVY
jgi:hypothetical protein